MSDTGVSEAPTSADTPRGKAPPLAKIAIGLVVLFGLYFVAREAGAYVPQVAAWVETLGFWGPFAFIAIYAAAVIGFVPGAVLTLAGGAIFDLVSGTLYVFTAAVIGSIGAFLVARYVARGAIEKRIEASPKFASIDRAVGQQGLKIIFLLRLSPAFPFSFLNYALGLTSVSLRDYILASFGMIPGTILYVYYGKLIGDVAALAGGAAPDKDAAYYVVLGLGLVATVIVTALVTRVASRALKEATES